MGQLEELGASITEIADNVGPSTVGIGNRWRGGSGVVLDDGKVLTNAHNLHGDEVTRLLRGRARGGSIRARRRRRQ